MTNNTEVAHRTPVRIDTDGLPALFQAMRGQWFYLLSEPDARGWVRVRNVNHSANHTKPESGWSDGVICVPAGRVEFP